MIKRTIESPVRVNLDYGTTGATIQERKMKSRGVFNQQGRGAVTPRGVDKDHLPTIGVRGKHSLQEFADKRNILTLDDKNTKDYRLVVGNIGDFETAAVTKEYRRAGLHPNVVRDYNGDGKLIYEVAASFWGDRPSAIVRARKLATGLGSSVQVVIGGVATEVQPDKAALCKVCSKLLVKTRLGKVAVMACPEFLNGDLKHTSFDVKKASNKKTAERVKFTEIPDQEDGGSHGGAINPVTDENINRDVLEQYVGQTAEVDDSVNPVETGSYYEGIIFDDGTNFWVGKEYLEKEASKQSACINITTWGDDEDIMIWTKNEGPGGDMMYGNKTADWDKVNIQTLDGYVEVYLGEGDKLLTTSDNTVISPTDLVNANDYEMVLNELKNGVVAKKRQNNIKSKRHKRAVAIGDKATDFMGDEGVVIEINESTNMVTLALPDGTEDEFSIDGPHFNELTWHSAKIQTSTGKQAMTFAYGPEESAKDDNTEYHVRLQGYYLPSGKPPTDLNQLLSPDLLARIDYTEMKEENYQDGGYWSGWDWWNGASEAGRAELLRNLEGTPLAMLAQGAEFLSQLEWMIIKTLIYRMAGGSATEGDIMIEDYVKPATNPDEPYAGTEVQLYIRLRGTMALGALVDALDDTAGWEWADISDSFGYVGDWWGGDSYGYGNCCAETPMYASLKPLLAKVRWQLPKLL